MNEKSRNDLIIEALRKRKAAESVVDVEVECLKIVIFRLAEDLYALPGSDVKEILQYVDISPVPGAPDFIPGVINNRGDIESVINLNRFLGIADMSRTERSRIAMVAKSGMRSGILIDEVLDVTDVPVDSIKPPISTIDQKIRDLVSGELMYQERSVVMLDLTRLFERLVACDG